MSLDKALETLKSPEFWIGIISVVALLVARWTGYELDQAKTLEFVMVVVAVVGALIAHKRQKAAEVKKATIAAARDVDKAQVAADLEVRKAAAVAMAQAQIAAQHAPQTTEPGADGPKAQ